VPPASAGEAGRWGALADTIIHPVARDADMTNVIIPESLAEDGRGFLWLGMETGLQRWDGYHLRAYSYERNRPDGLQDDFIQTLHRDARGRLWIGTVSGGLARYKAHRDQVLAVPLAGPVGSEHVWSMDDDGAGGLWVGTSGGLYHLDAESRITARFGHDAAGGALPNNVVSAVRLAHDGTLWVGTWSGLVKGVDGNTRFTAIRLPPVTDQPGDRLQGDATPKVTRLLEDSAGRLWVGTRQNGAYVVRPGETAAILLPATADEEGFARAGAATEITGIAEVSPGTIWLGTWGHGIAAVDAATLATRWIRHDPLVPNSLENDSVRAVFKDRAGLVWIGTNEGLSQHYPGNGGIVTIYGKARRPGGLSDEDILAFLSRPDGAVWVGTESGGIDIFDRSGRRINVLSVGRVFSLANAPAGGVLVATNDGLYLANDPGTRIAKLVVPQLGLTAGVFTLRVVAGHVWVGTMDDGLFELQIDAGGSVALLRHLGASRLVNTTVRALEELPQGRLAIGTDSGVDLLDCATGAIEHVRPDPADPEGLSAAHVMSLLTDRQGRLWVGTGSGGINVMERRDSSGRWRFHRLGVENGLPNADIDKMLLDAQGRIWTSTDNGLAVIDPSTFAVRALRRADGVAISAYWNGAGGVTPEGDLMFGGLGGITVVHPEKVVPWAFHPSIVVTGVRVGGRQVPAGQPSAHDPGAVWLSIPPDANSLAVDFASLDLSAPALNHYSYKLEGFDRDWVETDAAHRVADYTNLPPGDFTLLLRGSNRNGDWATLQPGLRIRVLPAWFQTLWFHLLEFAAVIVGVAILVQLRTLVLRQRQRELERQVADRTAELIASQQQLHHFAFVDVLTSLPNRRAFNDRFKAMIERARHSGGQFALLLIDLDGFKQVNDSLGHDAGDALLMLTATRMREALRQGDFAARLGGDEFAILLDRSGDVSEVDGICAALIASLSETALIAGAAVKGGASIGAAFYPRDGGEAEELLRHVDLALYEAKRSGRGIWRWYSVSQEPSVPARRAIRSR
jgi:diguanylate cyclase (GGDEF)-like protein